tara:strand:- start:29009 stop:33682 length:4674 start_codon:yes stop_codon:yes gene_type:complete
MKYFTQRLFFVSLVVISSLTAGVNFTFSQTFQWASAYQGASDVFGQDVATNTAGEVFSVGFFFGTADFDPSGGTLNLTSPGNQDIYITKLDAGGNLIWAQRFGNASRNRANNVTVDSNGDVYITGYFEGTVDFDPGPGTATLTSQFVVTAFVLKLDTDGNFLWVRQFGGSAGVSEGLEVVTDSNDDVIIGGYFTADCDFNPSGGGLVYNSTSGRDGYIAKLSSNGNFIWARHLVGDNDNRVNTVGVDINDNIFFGGFFSGQLDFDQFNPGTQTELTGSGPDIFLGSFDSNGMHRWSNSIVGAGNNQVNRLAVNRNGNLFISGQFEGTADFDPGAGTSNQTSSGGIDSYILSLDNDGLFNWVEPIGGAATDLGLGVASGPDGSAYVTGYFNGTANFDGVTTMTSLGGNTIYLARYLENGTLDWTERMGGASNNFGFNLTIDENWDVISTGYFNGTCDFDPDGANFPITSLGGDDGFVSKLSQTCTAPTITGTGTLDAMLCPGIQDSTRVYIDGTLNDAVEWAWYEGSCGGTYLGSGDSLTVRPTVNTAYFVRPEGQCGAPVACQTVTVNVDNTPPTITLTTPITVNTDPGTCYYPSANLTPPTVVDADCAVDTVYNDADLLMLPGLHVVTWTAIDVNGNTATATQDVTVQDVELPAMTAPGNLTVAADASCQASGVALGTPTATDNCSIASITNDAPATFPLGTTIVTWTATDASGNIDTDTQEVTVEDQTDPTIVGLPADIVVSNDPGVCEAAVAWAAPVASDNCAGATITQTQGPANGSNFPVGTTLVEYTATDGAGNSVSGTFTVTVNDTENPTITVPADITVSADNACQANPALGSATTSDNCGVASVSNDAPASFGLGSTIVTWTVTDVNGNTTNDTQTVTVIDDIDPVIVNLPSDISVSNDAGNCSAVVSWTAPTATDNCAGVSISQIGGLASGSAFPVGITTVTYEALDGSGNTTTGSFDVIVTDDENPTITPPADVTVSAGNNCTASGVALGSETTNDNCGVASVTNDAPVIYPLGTTTVTWTVTDNSGNVATATQDVIVQDTDAPSVIAPADITVSADASCQGTVASLGTPVTDDNCSVASVTNDGLATYPLGNTTVTWTVTDGSGNVSTDTQTITVVDDTDPVINGLPANIVQSNDPGVCNAIVNWTAPTVSDNCSGATITQTSGIANGGSFPVGVTTVEYTATDGSGNSVTGSFTVTVNDDEDPTITAAADTTIAANNFCTALNVVLDMPTVNDNCGVQSVTNDAPVLFELDTTTVTWTVTDVNGNTATAIQLVIVADSTAPQISAPLPVTAYVDTLCQTAIDSLGTPITSDNCAIDTIYNNAPAVYTTGNYEITWYAEDAAGNIDSTIQIVTVLDTILPEPVLIDTTLTLDPSGPISLFGSDIDAGSTDNCGLDQVIIEQNSFDCEDLGTNIIAVQVIDVNGNIFDTSIVVAVEESGIDLDFDQIDDACDDNINTTVVVVPTGFTPNGDGINDLLVITALSNYTTVKLNVFNRYGNLVYESDQYNNDWDGTNSKNGMELPDGTYFYTLELDGGEILNGYIHINRTL